MRSEIDFLYTINYTRKKNNNNKNHTHTHTPIHIQSSQTSIREKNQKQYFRSFLRAIRLQVGVEPNNNLIEKYNPEM